MTLPSRIARARRLAGALLAVTVLVVLVSALLLVNWWLNRPVPL